MATQATPNENASSNDDITMTLPRSVAIQFLSRDTQIPIDVYIKAVNDAVATGHDLNETGILLLGALALDSVDKVSFLFSIGAQVANATGIFGKATSFQSAYGRMHDEKLANLLLSHTMSSKHFDVIKEYLVTYKEYINAFIHVSPCNNAELAAFYIRLGALPSRRTNAEVQKLCGAADLWYPDVKAEKEKANAQAQQKEKEKTDNERLSAENEGLKAKLGVFKELFNVSEVKLAVTEEKLAAETVQLAKAQEIIKKLTDL